MIEFIKWQWQQSPARFLLIWASLIFSTVAIVLSMSSR